MKVVIDASALISILADEPGAAAAVAVASTASVSAVNLAEARDHLSRSVGSTERVANAIEVLVGLGLQVVACDRPLAERAADLRSDRYHRRRSALSLADCFAVALAQRDHRTLVSSDGEQLRAAVELGVAVHPIANSQGVVPEV